MNDNTNVQNTPQTTEERVKAGLKKKLRKKRTKRIITWSVVAIIIILAVYSYRFYTTNGRLPFTNAEKAAAAAEASATPAETTVRELQYIQTIDISGNVEAYQTQTVVFRSTGAVTGVFVKEGDTVTKGQLLATIDDTSQTYNLSNIESQIEEAELEGSVRQLELLEMQRTMAVNSLDYTKAYANFDGVVASVSVDEGDYFEAGDEAMVIIDRSKLKATVEVDEIDIQSVSKGMIADLVFDSLPGRTIEATIDYIPMLGRTTTQGIGVMDVEIVIEDPPAAIAPGFTFAGTISNDEEKKILVVSTTAVTSYRGVSTVRKKSTDGQFLSVTVTTKYLGEGMSQILSGDVKAGDVLMVGSDTNTMFNINIPGVTAAPAGSSGMGGGGMRPQ